MNIFGVFEFFLTPQVVPYVWHIRHTELKKTFYLILSILFIHAYGGQALLKPDLSTNYANLHES